MGYTTEFTIVDGTDLGSANIYTPVNFTFDIIITPDPLNTDPVPTAIEHTCTMDIDIPDSINIDNSGPLVITGEFNIGSFPNSKASYHNVYKGVNLGNPITCKPEEVPKGKNLFSVKPDSNATKLITITYNVKLSDDTIHTATYTYTIIQTYDSIKQWLQNYLKD